MAVARAVSRLVAGAELALAVSVLVACAGTSPAQPSAGGQPSAAASESGPTSGTAAPAQGGQPQPGGGQPSATQARTSLFDAFKVNGSGDTINLSGVPDGASCTVTAHRKGQSEQLGVSQDSYQFTLDNPPDSATIEWSATCTLHGESKTLPFETKIGSSEPPTPTPTTQPAHTATPSPAGPTPTASHT